MPAKLPLKPLSFTFATALVLSGCVYDNGQPNRPANGVLIGAATGAVLGNIIGDDDKSTIIGGVVGGVIGGAIGENMARQERELNSSLAGTGAQITNDGSHLRVILPESVTFPTGSSVVNSGFRPALHEVARSLRNHPNSTVRVVGHTDNVGTQAYNQQLSIDRALAVARILISDGISTSRIAYAGRNFAEPIASNATANGRAQNRRVEIIITPTN